MINHRGTRQAFRALRPCVRVHPRLARSHVLPPSFAVEHTGFAFGEPCDSRGTFDSLSEFCALAFASVNVPCDRTPRVAGVAAVTSYRLGVYSPFKRYALASAFIHVFREFQQWPSRLAAPLPTQSRFSFRYRFAPLRLRSSTPCANSSNGCHVLCREKQPKEKKCWRHTAKPRGFACVLHPPLALPSPRLNPYHIGWKGVE